MRIFKFKYLSDKEARRFVKQIQKRSLGYDKLDPYKIVHSFTFRTSELPNLEYYHLLNWITFVIVRNTDGYTFYQQDVSTHRCRTFQDKIWQMSVSELIEWYEGKDSIFTRIVEVLDNPILGLTSPSEYTREIAEEIVNAKRISCK